MAMNAKRKAEAPPEVRSRPEPAQDAAYAPPLIDNGAIELQRRVSQAFGEEQRWSPRRALFFMTSASLICWGLIGAGVAAILR